MRLLLRPLLLLLQLQAPVLLLLLPPGNQHPHALPFLPNESASEEPLAIWQLPSSPPLHAATSPILVGTGRPPSGSTIRLTSPPHLRRSRSGSPDGSGAARSDPASSIQSYPVLDSVDDEESLSSGDSSSSSSSSVQSRRRRPSPTKVGHQQHHHHRHHHHHHNDHAKDFPTLSLCVPLPDLPQHSGGSTEDSSRGMESLDDQEEDGEEVTSGERRWCRSAPTDIRASTPTADAQPSASLLDAFHRQRLRDSPAISSSPDSFHGRDEEDVTQISQTLFTYVMQSTVTGSRPPRNDYRLQNEDVFEMDPALLDDASSTPPNRGRSGHVPKHQLAKERTTAKMERILATFVEEHLSPEEQGLLTAVRYPTSISKVLAIFEQARSPRNAPINVNLLNGVMLALAAARNDVELLQILLDHGGDASISESWPLLEAASSGAVEAVEMLLKYGANVHALHDQAVINAAAHGHADALELLLRHGGNANAQNTLALRDACLKGYYMPAALLIRYNANVHVNREEPLRNAARNGHYYIVALLLERGADARLDNAAPLRLAIEYGQSKVVPTLFQLGHYDLRLEGEIAREAVQEFHRPEMTATLLDLGVEMGPSFAPHESRYTFKSHVSSHHHQHDHHARPSTPALEVTSPLPRSTSKSDVRSKLFSDLQGGFRVF